ncbi:MAG: hypothetical protein IT236_08965 [Bacteroidia bacterium]|nr:hypothetical protein [Bacteroidia bacterium]
MSESRPQIIIEDFKGWNEKQTREEKLKRNAFKDLSTILIIPCYSRGIHPKVVQNWMNIMTPMNQKFVKIFVTDMEVGAAYSQTIEQILSDPNLSKFKYIATLEHDNIVAPDWLLKMYPDMEEYDVLGAIYYTKGIGGAPMCYGRTDMFPVNFIPFEPEPNAVTRCNGLGMGANLFKLDVFKNTQLPKPLFETVQTYQPGIGAQAYTQDLRFFENAGKLGYKFGCTTKTTVGHMDIETGFVW